MSKKSSNEDKAGKEGVKVSIMQREFTVACSREERQSVVEAAAYLDKQMRAVAKGTQVLGVDRCAIMAGLNITHSLLRLEKTVEQNEDATERLKNLHAQVDKFVSGAK